MEFKDINGKIIEQGMNVLVPDADENLGDFWDNEFVGYVVSLDNFHNFVIVEDGDGDCFSVEPERVEITF